MKKIAIILLMGNRDLQISKANREQLPSKYTDWLEPNTEPGTKQKDKYTHFVLSKTSREQSFYDISKLFLDGWNDVKNHIEFYFLDKSMEMIAEELGSDQNAIDVYAVTSNQNPHHPQDCVYVAQLLEKYLKEKSIPFQERLFTFNPNAIDQLIDHMNTVYDEVEQKGYDAIYVSNSGGTPAMRAGTHFAGLFKGLNFITISSSSEKNTATFEKQEKEVLRNTLEKLLKHYNYQGIMDLPFEQENIKQLCAYAHHRKGLAFDDARKTIENDLDNPVFKVLYDEINPDTLDYKALEIETVYSAMIAYNNDAFSDYLWRVFALSENIYTKYLIEHSNQIDFDFTTFISEFNAAQNKFQKKRAWKRFLNRHQNLNNKLRQVNLEGNLWYRGGPSRLIFDTPSAFVYKSIYKLFNLGGQKATLLDQLDQNFKKLRQRRNDAAHNLDKGVSKETVELDLNVSFDIFNELLIQYYDLNAANMGPYDRINQQIRDWF